MLAQLTTALAGQDESAQCAAFNDILKMANTGNSDAMYQVARCLSKGLGVCVDPEKADYWLRLACSTTEPSNYAFFTLGVQHITGQRHDADCAKGLGFVERASRAGFVEATIWLATAFETGDSGLPQNLKRAYRLFAESVSGRTLKPEALMKYQAFVETHAHLMNHLLDS